MINFKKKKTLAITFAFLLIIGLVAGCGNSDSAAASNGKVVFADVGWDSIKLHNAIAGYVAETAYDLSWEEVNGSTPIMHEALKKGDLDVHMENWTSNLPTYDKDLEAGEFVELGLNFGDNRQGFYVPRYVIEGDPAKGIEPMAPDLKHVADLKNYKDLFVDEEEPGKGRIYGAISGWEVDMIMYNKVQHYGLGEDFNYFRPGSQAAMDAVFASAYEKGQPTVGYYWEPTWLTGKYDLVLLEDEPYNPDTYADGETECPSVPVTIASSNQFAEEHPEYIEFLKKYETSSLLTSEGLAHMQDTGADYKEAAQWFLKTNDELLDQWLSDDKAELVRSSLK